MKIHVIGSPEIVMSNPDSKHCAFAWPTIKRIKNGKIAVAASGFRRRHVCPFGKTVICFSENEGKTYSLPTPVIDTVLDDRDGGLCPFGENGLIITSFNLKVERQRAMNKTYTENGWMDWDTQPKAIGAYIDAYMDTITPEEEEKYRGVTYKISYDNGTTFGPLMKSPVTSPHGPIELQDGTVLWVGSGSDGIESHIIKLDGTMEKIGQIAKIVMDDPATKSCEPYTIQLSDGTLICHIRLEPYFTLFQSVSKDNGKTWSTPKRLLEDKGGAPGHILEHSSGVLIGTYGHRKTPFGVKVMFSHDKGQTWDTGYQLYAGDDRIDVGYPSTVELSDGSLLTVFYSQVDDTQPSVIMQQKWSFED